MSILAPTRRGFLRFLGAGIIAAPTIVRASSLMALPFRRPFDMHAATLDVLNRTLMEAAEKAVNPPVIFRGGVTWIDREYNELLGAALRPLLPSQIAGNTAWFSRGPGAFDL